MRDDDPARGIQVATASHFERELIEARAEIERLRAMEKIVIQNDARRGPSYPADQNDYCFGRCLMPALRAALNPHEHCNANDKSTK